MLPQAGAGRRRPRNRQAAGTATAGGRPAPHDTTSTQPPQQANKSTAWPQGRTPRKETIMHIVLCCNQGLTHLPCSSRRCAKPPPRTVSTCRLTPTRSPRSRRRLPDAAVILLGPQVRFELNRVEGRFPEHPGRVHQPAGLRPGARRERAATTRSSSPVSDLPSPGVARYDGAGHSLPLFPTTPTPRMTVRREPVTGAANTDERTVQWRTHPKPLTWKCCACR